jgi:predicted glycosyltransferase
MTGPRRYVFSSHDGYGLGHVRRNVLIARAIRALDPSAQVTIVTGVPAGPAWLGAAAGMEVVRVPPLLKRSDGSYLPIGMEADQAIERRRRRFEAVIEDVRPHVVVVDRHPYGTAGELRDALLRARRDDASLVLGLRDILDDPQVVAAEIVGAGWEGAEDLFDEVLVYGERRFCDHRAEYGLSVEPSYCGWVTESVPPGERDGGRLVIAAGGGGDGGPVFRLGLEVLDGRPAMRGEIVVGPYADVAGLAELVSSSPALDRVKLLVDADGCIDVFARASAVLEMAGYNSTFEALAAGQRPILVPRRAPRREQAIRAERLQSLGLADVVDERADAAQVDPLLDRPRQVPRSALEAAGIRLDGAHRAAAHLQELAAARSAA